MDLDQQQFILPEAVSHEPAPGTEVIEDGSFSYEGYEVVRGEFFSHIYEPSVSFKDCIHQLRDLEFIHIAAENDIGLTRRGDDQTALADRKRAVLAEDHVNAVLTLGNIFDVLVCDLLRHFAAECDGIFIGLAPKQSFEERHCVTPFRTLTICQLRYYFTINVTKCHRFYQDSRL